MGDYSMDQIKCLVRSIAISGSSHGLTVKDLARDFKNIEGFDLPYRRLGFQSLDQFLHTLNDTVTIRGSGPMAHVEPIVAQSNKHIREYVQASKKPRSYKKPNNNYYNSSYNRSYPNNNYGKRGGYNSSYNSSYNRPNNYKHDNRASEPRKVVNNEYDFHDAFNEPDSDSSGNMPKFTMSEDKKLVQIPETAASKKNSKSMSNEALPDGGVIEFVNSLEVPVKAMRLGDVVAPAIVSDDIAPKGTVRMFVTEVHNPNRFWYHLGDSAKNIDEMMNEIEEYYSHLEREEWRLKPANATVGFYCVAKYNSLWHRAKIVGEYIHNKVKVFYIDYGTVAELELKDLKYMAKCFADVPAQAMRASLAYVKPVNHRWTRDASWSLLSLVFDKLLFAYVVDVDREDNIIHVVLIDTTGPSDCIVNQQLFVKGHATWEDDLPYKEKSTEAFQNRRKSYCEVFPRFQDIENGSYPALTDIGVYHKQGFNFDRYYTQAMHTGLEYIPCVTSKIFAVNPGLVLSKTAAEAQNEIEHPEADSLRCESDQCDPTSVPAVQGNEPQECRNAECPAPSQGQRMTNGSNSTNCEQLSSLESQENTSYDDQQDLELIIPKGNAKRKQVRFIDALLDQNPEPMEKSPLAPESKKDSSSEYVRLVECTEQCK